MRMQDTPFSLHGRLALVVGGTGNIGRCLCKGLAAQGADLVIADRIQDECDALKEELASSLTGRYAAASADCTVNAGIESVMRTCDRLGPIHIVVHCVGLLSSVPISGYAAPFEEQSLEAWDLALKVNLTSAFLLSQHVRKRLDQRGSASVIFISSIYGSLGPDWSIYENTAMGNPLAYGASKGGLQQVMRYLATLWSPAVRVNCVSPGGVQRGQAEAFVRQYEKRTPLRRMAHPEDIVGPVMFLASDAARYVTGQNILVDGGWSAW
jgi:NAD(P)-dependent dehydrogenase (short-subunit alcohol dehydrogenase family)